MLEDLTVHDALILIAVCAAKEKVDIDDNHIDYEKLIAALVQDHPIFSGLADSIDPSINKYMNIIDNIIDDVNYVSAAAKVLKPELKEIAFTWATKIIMPDGVLTKVRKNILEKYALLLNIDSKDVPKILVKFSNQQ